MLLKGASGLNAGIIGCPWLYGFVVDSNDSITDRELKHSVHCGWYCTDSCDTRSPQDAIVE